ncbi:F-box/kelch-repeat protein At3g06240 isoform X1 [Lactuca sativa]|uniref:F-box/kelch-repeat protein At3g06240 isoform X1 n=1 Tax=Lactuca sativa TaxID=4236 RepID=UPI0022B043B7|nr:F-box/kelch-repeat protein At3g06240 isoform X1 [Lactuca sativa]
MATAGDRGAPEEFWNSHLRPEIYEEPQNVYQEARRNNSSGVSDLSTHQAGISELEQMLKHMTFTRSETLYLIALLHSRTIKESPSDNFLAASKISRVFEKQIASPTELANANKALIQDSKFINKNATMMASPQQPTTIENLPNELLVNIFIRLLAKQLAQMRSVSKSWNSLLSKSSFVKTQLHHSIFNKDKTLFHFSDDHYYGFKLSVNPNPQLISFIKLPPNPESPHTSIRVIDSVNGLICSSYSDSIIQIWNPSLSAILTLPPYFMPCSAIDSIRIFFRFGFEPKTDDYKVVKLTAYANGSSVIWWMDVEIYSMRKGSWKLIIERVPSHITWIDENEVVCADGHDGHLHWLGYITEEMNLKTILSFDLGSETFREIPLPDSTVATEYGRSTALGVLGGKLCVMSWAMDDPSEVWVMEEYGWVKRHVFSQFIGDTYPFGFTSANKFLIQDQYYRLVLYDPVTEEAQILKNDFSFPEYLAGKIVEYIDSLVWVAPAKREMVDA